MSIYAFEASSESGRNVRDKKYLIVYGHDPYENFSAAVGKILQEKPPENADVRYFRPSTITLDHLELSGREREKAARAGTKELRKYALDSYNGKLPFIIDLHDFPLYNHNSGDLFQDFEKYQIMYPGVNKYLGNILEQFRNTHRKKNQMLITPDFRSGFSAYHEFDFEFYPIKIRHDGTFEIMKVEEAVKMVREAVRYVQENC